jgi:hypothetical protein
MRAPPSWPQPRGLLGCFPALPMRWCAGSCGIGSRLAIRLLGGAVGKRPTRGSRQKHQRKREGCPARAGGRAGGRGPASYAHGGEGVQPLRHENVAATPLQGVSLVPFRALPSVQAWQLCAACGQAGAPLPVAKGEQPAASAARGGLPGSHACGRAMRPACGAGAVMWSMCHAGAERRARPKEGRGSGSLVRRAAPQTRMEIPYTMQLATAS